MDKIMQENREEILEFFRLRGERCVKIAALPSQEQSAKEFVCFVLTNAGKKEKVVIRIQQPIGSPSQVDQECVV